MLKKIFWSIGFTLLLYSCENSNEANLVKPLTINTFEDINQLLSGLDSSNDFMGNILIYQGGKKIFDRSLGFSNINDKTIFDENTPVKIGSISKTFTATLVFKTIEQGLIKIDQSINGYFPDLPNSKKITIRHLLNHQSGIKSYTSSKEFMKQRTSTATKDSILDEIINYPSLFNPGTQSQYSNSNYFLLASLLERIHNESYDQLIKETIVVPLELNNTFVFSDLKSQTIYPSYIKTPSWKEFEATNPNYTFGAGSIIASSSDTNRFIQALFNEELITKDSLELMLKSHNGLGHGMNTYTVLGRKGFGHRGSLDGFKSIALYFPDENLSLTILSNAASSEIPDLTKQILGKLWGIASQPLAHEQGQQYAGKYQSPNDPSDTFEFSYEDKTLILIIKGEFKEPLIYNGSGEFIFEQMYASPMLFTFSDDGQTLKVVQGSYQGEFNKP